MTCDARLLDRTPITIAWPRDASPATVSFIGSNDRHPHWKRDHRFVVRSPMVAIQKKRQRRCTRILLCQILIYDYQSRRKSD
jgi:hypothetical protein